MKPLEKEKKRQPESGSNWHAMEATDAIRMLGSNFDGLSQDEIEARLREFGYNQLRKRKRASPLQIFLSQFKNVFTIILLVAIAISVVLGWYESQALHEPRTLIETYIDSIVIGAIVVLNAVVGFFQEYRSEKAIEAMEKLTAPQARVLRSGKERQVQAKEIVPGDILLLDTGDRIAADGRLIQAIDLEVDEAVLTGESNPVAKDTMVLPVEATLAERRNMVFMGTHVIYGRGRAIVTSTGTGTQFGKISEMVQTVEKEEIPLKLKLDKFAKRIGILAVIAAVSILVLAYVRNGGIELELLLTSVALAVSAVPEGLPTVVTVTLALGARELSKRNAVVRRLASVETLGSTTVICSDKTGTLTKGEMTVRKIYCNDQMVDVTGTGYQTEGEFLVNGKPIDPTENDQLALLLRISLLCNNAAYDGSTVTGDTTEGALIVAAAKGKMRIDDVKKEYERVAEIPFSSERKLMTTIHATPEGQYVSCVKGSIEQVLQLCSFVYEKEESTKLTEKLKREILGKNEELASQALRVLGVAYKAMPTFAAGRDEENAEKDLVFVGLIGMIDPPREEAKEAVKLCEQGSIKVVMITGDHKLTAVAVARELGILKDDSALTGDEIDGLSDEEFGSVVEKTRVYARVSPEHKLRIVRTLKKNGHVVAMTGDGVNDAPAVKQADIGVAMGITGTDVTKEASDMVLADDNFATIVNAVKGGRVIYDNIRKVIRFLVSLNFTELLLVSSFALIGLPIPIFPAMILWLNLVTDGPPAIALSMDPPTDDVMKRPPRSPREGVLYGASLFIVASTLIHLAADATAFWWGFGVQGSIEKGRTMVFVVACLFELVVVWNCRSERHNAFKVGFFNNKALLAAVLISVLSTFAVITIPPLQFVFQTVPLSLTDWVVVVLLASTGFLVVPEIFMRRNKSKK